MSFVTTQPEMWPVSLSGWRENLTRSCRIPPASAATARRGFDRVPQHRTVKYVTDAYVDAINAAP